MNRHLWALIKPVRPRIHLAMLAAVCAALLALLALLVMADTLRRALGGEVSGMQVMLLVALTLCAWFLRSLSFVISHRAAFALERILRMRLSRHMAKVPLGFLYEQGAPALVKILQDDIRDLHVFVADSTPLYARAYAAPLFTMLALLYLDWRLALAAFAILAVGMLLLAPMMKQSEAIRDEFNAARERVNAAVVEFVQGMPVVRTFDGGQSSFGRYRQALAAYLEVLVRWYRLNGPAARLSLTILNPMPTLIVLLWCGLYVWQGGYTDFSTWLAVLLLGTGMAEALMPYMVLYHMIDKARIGAMRINALEDTPELPLHAPVQMPADNSIAFVDVSFTYPQRTEKALQHVSFTAPAGSFTALVGASGAGKTTVARLIPRFWDVSEGSILLGGADIRSIPGEVLMRHIAFVFQDNFLFSGSIADNIRLGCEDADDAALHAAARAAQIHDFIQTLPEGYASRIGERGTTLSGGQRQRITIARAILQNRPVLVLDEATAFTDAENEALIMQALHSLMRGKTVFMIAHRLTTIRHADQILVFKQGRLSESGCHEALMAKNGDYAHLWQMHETAKQWRIAS